MNNKWPLGGHVFLTDLNHFLTLPRYKTAPLPGGHVISLIMTIFKLAKHVTSRVKKMPPPPGSHETNVLTKFQLTRFYYSHMRKNAPPIGSHVFQAKFHEDRKINVASRPYKKNAPPPGGHVFQPTDIIYERVQDIVGMNLLTKFHEDRTINVASRVKNAPPLGSHVFKQTQMLMPHNARRTTDKRQSQNLTMSTLCSAELKKMHYILFAHLRGFHDDWAKNVISRVHVIQLTGTTFKLNSHIKERNVLTKFHENWAKNKNALPTGGHVFSLIWTIFELVRDINKTNVLTKFHDDWAKIVTSRVFIRKTAPSPPPPTGSHETNVLTKFHENLAKNVTSRVFTCFHFIHIEKNAPPTGGHVFSPIWTIFELVRDINKTNVLTNFHDDWAKIVTSRVFTRKTAPPTGVFTSFELNRGFIGTKLLKKFHEDRTIIVASRVFTNQMLTTDGQTTDKDRSQKLP
ncbi:hypothetical protein DPMN_011112 [Dreissena polymorpha]|uniref:Uncharacterized protein n=1 Tax=Dreissena polymorpha TaxID=45954 RepID=A0A9D4N5G9_DREPO|nr:hypothetical protein DPMN_011112 [Dreissena polymorpha]